MKNKIHVPNGIFVAIEGIDGTGKTTLSLSLKSHLESVFNVYTTREPSDTDVGRKLRNSFSKGRLSPEEEAQLFVEDRELHLRNEIEPFMNRGFIVVTDRYYFSNIAYQGAVGVSIDKLKDMNSKFLLPDLVLYIDLDVDTALDRIIKDRGSSNLMEKRENILKVKSIYNDLRESYSDIFVTVDGSQDKSSIGVKSSKIILSHSLQKIVDIDNLSFTKEFIKKIT